MRDTAECSTCGRRTVLLPDGTLWVHGPFRDRCHGSGMPPVRGTQAPRQPRSPRAAAREGVMRRRDARFTTAGIHPRTLAEVRPGSQVTIRDAFGALQRSPRAAAREGVMRRRDARFTTAGIHPRTLAEVRPAAR